MKATDSGASPGNPGALPGRQTPIVQLAASVVVETPFRSFE